MASGKSRTGRAMADRLQRPFIDTDSVIVERAGKSISEIFEQDGEAKFREMEREVIAEIAKKNGLRAYPYPSETPWSGYLPFAVREIYAVIAQIYLDI